MLEQNDEERRVAIQIIKAAKTQSKSHYDSHAHPPTFSGGDFVLIYDQANDKIGKGKFESLWYGPYVIHRCLGKEAYILSDSKGHVLKNPHNGLYLKRLYP